MLFNKKVVFALLLTSGAFADQSLRGRQLEGYPCGELSGCYLWDKTAKTEVMLTGEDSYCPSDSPRGWSVRCDTDYPVVAGETAVIDEIKFYYDGMVQDEYGEPRWMNGDNDPTNPGEDRWINDVAYLATPGDKTFNIEGRQWSKMCFEKTFKLTDSCPPPPPPAITECIRASYKLSYLPVVDEGVTVEARDPASKQKRLELTSQGGKNIRLTNDERLFFKAIKPNTPDLRFVINGVPGPWKSCSKNTPIGLDIDNSGAVERIVGDFTIDITGDGQMELLTEWFAPTEGILINMMPFIKDGKVTGQNLFGDMGRKFADGYEKLSLLDKNTDHVISGLELDGLAIWTDTNSNARLDDGELSTLQSHGIVGLRTDGDANFVSSAVLTDGSEMYMEDLWFAR